MSGAGHKPLEVIFYRTRNGREPVRDWLKSLSKIVKTVIGSDIQRVQWRWPLSLPLVDGLGGGLYEVRSTVDDIEYRVLFCVDDGEIILLHGFVKKSQREPREIKVGRDRKRDHESQT